MGQDERQTSLSLRTELRQTRFSVFIAFSEANASNRCEYHFFSPCTLAFLIVLSPIAANLHVEQTVTSSALPWHLEPHHSGFIVTC